MKIRGLLLLMILSSGCAKHAADEDRPPQWAKKVELVGVPNFFKISPDLYRSEQPTREGMRKLEGMGIKTVISLRAFHSDRRLLEGTGLAYERISFQTWSPDDEELVRFIKIVTDPRATPVLFHCLHGSDRTGAMSAAYRIVVEGWTKDAAIAEMKRGGYGHHKIWGNLERWLRSLDVEKLRVKVGANID